jgi:hypothetical protein
MSFHGLWISTGVGAGENDYRLGYDTIPNQIRESANDCSAYIAMNKLINERCFGETINDARYLKTEIRAEAGLLRFVPDLRLGDVQLSGATNVDFVAQGVSRSRRALTSGHGH